MQPKPQRGFRLNPLSIIGGMVVLVSPFLPWVNVFGLVSANLISYVSELWGSRYPEPAVILGATLALILVLIGGVFSLVHPAGGIASIAGSVAFFAGVPYFQGIGPYAALLGGIAAVSGLLFPGVVRIVPLSGQSVSGVYPEEPAGSSGAPREPLPPSDRMFCPNCGAHYPEDYKVCPKDATELKPMQ